MQTLPLTLGPTTHCDICCVVKQGGGFISTHKAQRKEPVRQDSTGINTTNTSMHLYTHPFTFTLVGYSTPATDRNFRIKTSLKIISCYYSKTQEPCVPSPSKGATLCISGPDIFRCSCLTTSTINLCVNLTKHACQ